MAAIAGADAAADENRHLAREHRGPANAATAGTAATIARTGDNAQSAAEPERRPPSRSLNNPLVKIEKISHAALASAAFVPLKPRIPWRGSFSSPAAWSHRLEKGFFPPPWERSFKCVYKVRIRKFDPYLNVDPGTMSPYQHGEVYVTETAGD